MIRTVEIKDKNHPNWFFIIREIDSSRTDYDESTAHQHNYYQFLFFIKGSGIHIIHDKQYKVTDNSIHFISPKKVHHLQIENHATGFVCMFKEELLFVNNESNRFIESLWVFSEDYIQPVVAL